MNTKNITEILNDGIKALVGYTETSNKCKTCLYFKEDPSTDNFGPGNLCGRNPDIQFSVKSNAVCNKWASQQKEQPRVIRVLDQLL